MGLTSEIFLTKKDVLGSSWLQLMKKITEYNGVFNKARIIAKIDRNEIRFFLKTKCQMPTMLNGINSFIFKKSNDDLNIQWEYIAFAFAKEKENIIDLINFLNVKNKGNLKYLEISFRGINKDRLIYKVNYFVEKDNKMIKYRMFFGSVADLLTINFSETKGYWSKGCPKYLEINKVLHLLSTDSCNSLLKVDTFPYIQGDFYLGQSSFSFDKHSLILGASGSGKSKFLSLLINNLHNIDIWSQNYRVVVIDPHAALEDDIGGLGKVIDFVNGVSSIDLFANSDDTIAATELLLDLFKTLMVDQFNSKLERVLRYSIYILLANKAFNFINLKKLLLEIEYRNDLVNNSKKLVNVNIVDFFLTDFNELKTKSYGEAISPIIGFIDEMEMIPVFNETKTNDTLEETIKNNFLTLFSLDRVKLGNKVTKMVAGLIMQQLLTLVQTKRISQHIIFVVDEIAVVENPILTRFLAEARKYNLSLILAGQYFTQISSELKEAIFANVINYFIFRVSKLDAISLVDNFNMKIPLNDTKEEKVKMLMELNNRECIVRIENSGKLMSAFKGTTVNFDSIPRIKENDVIKNVKVNNEKVNNFSLDESISLHNLLTVNSTSRKEG